MATITEKKKTEDNNLGSPIPIRFTGLQRRWLDRMLREDGVTDLAALMRGLIMKEGRRRRYQREENGK